MTLRPSNRKALRYLYPWTLNKYLELLAWSGIPFDIEMNEFINKKEYYETIKRALLAQGIQLCPQPEKKQRTKLFKTTYKWGWAGYSLQRLFNIHEEVGKGRQCGGQYRAVHWGSFPHTVKEWELTAKGMDLRMIRTLFDWVHFAYHPRQWEENCHWINYIAKKFWGLGFGGIFIFYYIFII